MKFFSNSRITTFMMCPRKYMLHYIEGIDPIEEREPLTIGTLFHEGVETGKIPDLSSLEPDKQAMVEGMIKGALKRWKDDKTVEKELELLADLGGGDVLKGVIDEIIEREGKRYICDYKTASNRSDPDKYTSQLFKYFFLASAHELKIDGIMVKVVYKSRIRKKKKENDSEFANRMFEEYNEERYFDEFIIEFNDYNIIDEMLEFKEAIQLLKMADAQGVYPKNYMSCNMFGKCEYYQYCNRMEGAEYLYE